MIEVLVALTNLDWGFLYSWPLLALFIIFVYQPIKTGRILLNSIRNFPVWLLLFSGCIYAWRYSQISRNSLFACIILYCINMVLVYIAGYTIVYSCKRDAGHKTEWILFAIAAGNFVHVVLSITANLGVDRVQTVDYFGGGMAATNLGAVATAIYALLPCLMIIEDKRVKILGFVAIVAAVVYSVILGTRTQLYSLILMAVVCAFIYLKSHYAGKLPIKKMIKWVACAAFFALIVAYLFRADIGGIQTNFMNSNLVRRYLENSAGQSNESRKRMLMMGLRGLFEHPLGGHSTGIDYYHNYWLDIWRVAGTLPVILVLLVDGISTSHMLRIFRQKRVDESLRYALLGFYFCFFLNFFFEPIMDGYMTLLYRFTLVNGMVEALYTLTVPRRRTRQGKAYLHRYDRSWKAAKSTDTLL